MKQSTEVTAAAFAPSGRLVASGGADRTARLWDTRMWEQTQVLRGHVGRVLTVSFDRSGQRVGTGSTDQTARVWRSRTGVLDTLLYGHTGYVQDVSFGADGQVVTASGDGTARTWGANGRPLQTLRGHRGAVTAAVFSADGAVVTAGADGTIRIWDPGTSVELRPTRSAGPPDPSTTARSSTGAVATAIGSAGPPPHGGGGTSSARTPGCRQLRLVQPGRSLARHRRSRPRRHRLGRRERRAGAPLRRGAFGLCRGRAVQRGRTVDRHRRADLRPALERRGRRPLGYLYGPKSPLTAVAFGPDSRTVVSKEEDGTVRRYVCELCGRIDELTALARSRLRATGRTLTADERARYLG